VSRACLHDFAGVVCDGEFDVEVSVEDSGGGVDERLVEVEHERLVFPGVCSGPTTSGRHFEELVLSDGEAAGIEQRSMAVDEVFEEDVLVVLFRGLETGADLAHVSLEVCDVVVGRWWLEGGRATEQRLKLEGLLQARATAETADGFNLGFLYGRVSELRLRKDHLLAEHSSRLRQRPLAFELRAGRVVRVVEACCGEGRELQRRDLSADRHVWLGPAFPLSELDGEVSRELRQLHPRIGDEAAGLYEGRSCSPV